MSYPPIHAVCAAASGVTSLLGTNPVRFYPFGQAPESISKPYAVWQTVSGSPENFINEAPDIDSFSLQVDAYAATATAARNVSNAIRDAIESSAHIVSWNGEFYESETKLYRVSFSVDWWVHR